MMELFIASVGILGIICLGIAIFLLYRAGIFMLRAIEIHADTISAINQVRVGTQKEYAQIQEWVEQINSGLEETNQNSTGVRDYCARNFVEIERKVQGIEKTFVQLSLLSGERELN